MFRVESVSLLFVFTFLPFSADLEQYVTGREANHRFPQAGGFPLPLLPTNKGEENRCESYL